MTCRTHTFTSSVALAIGLGFIITCGEPPLAQTRPASQPRTPSLDGGVSVTGQASGQNAWDCDAVRGRRQDALNAQYDREVRACTSSDRTCVSARLFVDAMPIKSPR